MATKTKNRPPNQDDPNRIQDDYDQKFDGEKLDNRKSDTEDPGLLSEQEANFSDSEETGDEAESQEREQIEPETTEESTESGSGEFQYTSGGGKTKKKSKRKWKRIAVGGGILGLVGGSVIMLYYFLPLLKVAHVLNNIESRFMGLAVNAIESRAETLLSKYMRNYVFRSLNDCPGRMVSIDCNPNYDPGNGISANLYRNWSNARIEEKLFTNHGILIEHRGGDNYTITTKAGNSVDVVGSTFEISDLDRQNVGAREVRRELKKVLENETFWKRLMMRHSVRKLASSKYNVRWCVFACDTQDNIRETTHSALTRLKLKMVERTIGPFSDRLGLYLTCAITDCSNERFATERSRIINQAVEELGEEEVERIITEVSDRRLSQVFVDKIVSKVFGTVAGRGAASAVPIVGWIYLMDAINEIDTKLYSGVISQFLADSVASQYAEFYLTYKTNFDESVDNQLSLDEVGAQSQLLDGLEGSLVFQRDLGSGAGPTAGINIFSPVSAQAEPYLCADDNPIPEGELVCEERKVGKQSGYDAWRQSEEAALISGLTIGSYRCGVFIAIPQALSGDYCEPGSSGDVVWFFDDLAHQVFRLFNSAIDFISGALVGLIPDELIDALGGFVAQITQLVLEFAFPYLEPGTGPGRQVFDDLYAGVDVVGNEFARGFEDPLTGDFVGLGGRRLTDQEVEANLALYQQNQQDDFKNQSLFARVFSTDDSQSLVSRIALGTPVSQDFSDTNRNLLAFFNPLRVIGNISGLLMSPSYAQDNGYQGDPFGIHQYGYSVNDTALTMDPDLITPEDCAPGGSLYETWAEGANDVAVDGQLVQETTNPCMLEYVTTNILGCWFTESDDCGVEGTAVVGPGENTGGVAGNQSPVAGLVSHPNLGDTQPNGYFQVPAAPNGEYDFWSATPLGQRCGSRALVDLIYTVSVRWSQKYPNDRILVGDLNAAGHQTHMNGVNWDIWLESSNANGSFGTNQKAKELGRMLADTGIVKSILYNVTDVQNDFNAYTAQNSLPGTMSYYEGHFNHMHLTISDEFRGPDSTSCSSGAAFLGPTTLAVKVEYVMA